jgi:hypothetical protein
VSVLAGQVAQCIALAHANVCTDAQQTHGGNARRLAWRAAGCACVFVYLQTKKSSIMRCSKCSCGAHNTECVGMGPLSGGMRAKQVTGVEGASCASCKRQNGVW